MPPELRQANHSKLFRYVSKYTAAFWGVSFIKELEVYLDLTQRITDELDPRKLPKLLTDPIIKKFKASTKKKVIWSNVRFSCSITTEHSLLCNRFLNSLNRLVKF